MEMLSRHRYSFDDFLTRFTFLFFGWGRGRGRGKLRCCGEGRVLPTGGSASWRTRLHFQRSGGADAGDIPGLPCRDGSGKDATPSPYAMARGDRRPGGRRRSRRPRRPCRPRRVGPSVPDIAPRPRDRRGFAAARPEFFARLSSGGNSEAWQAGSALHAIRRQGGPKVCPTNGPPPRLSPTTLRCIASRFPSRFSPRCLHASWIRPVLVSSWSPLSGHLSSFWYLEGTTWEISTDTQSTIIEWNIVRMTWCIAPRAKCFLF